MSSKTRIILLILLVIAALGIMIPSMISYEVEEAIEKHEQKLSQQIPNNDSLYSQFYQSNLVDSLGSGVSRIQAEVAKTEGLLGEMWSRLDSANNRRKNKSYSFIEKERYPERLLIRLNQLDSLMQDIQPEINNGLGIYPASSRSDSSWQAQNFSGQAFTVKTYVTQWVYNIKSAEQKVLKAILP